VITTYYITRKSKSQQNSGRLVKNKFLIDYIVRP